jgi:CHAD domain-containing protein
LEVEAKFSIPDEQTYQRLLAATSLAGYSLEEPSLLNLHDRYLDTADRAILAGGYACRIRQQGGITLATLKGLGSASGAIHRRVELEVEIPAPLPPQQWPPSAARDLALSLCDARPLVPLLEADQARHRCHLCQGDRVVAELNLDRVRLHQKDQTSAVYLELEVELLPSGSEEELEQIAKELQAGWVLLPQSQSKFERGIDLFGSGPAPHEGFPIAADGLALDGKVVDVPPTPAAGLLYGPGIEPDDPMSEAGRKIFRFHYQRMVYHEPGTRLGTDIEALHDMRVATRRMRAAFRVFGPYYKPKAVAAYRKGLQRTGRTLGPVRDLDVFHSKIENYLSTLPESQQHDLDGFLVVLEAHRDAARERMNAYLDTDKYRRFKDRFGQFTEAEGMGSRPITIDDREPQPYRVRHVAPLVIYQRMAAVRAYDEWVSIPNPPPERLHALRIACKRLRYTLEFFQEVLGPDAKTVIRSIVIVQDHLGNLQDAIVACALLHDFLQRGTWGHDTEPGSQPATPVDAPGVETYLAAKQAEAELLLETFPGVWQPLHDKEFSRMVAEAIAAL